ncbi:MAG: DUF1559 domain-containing protein [Pirellulales bacterium]|nr:DUF1559 domain-containing protein [Pirellulales bacterium]
MQFGLRTLFLVFFLVAAAFGAFGAGAVVAAPYLIALGVSVRMTRMGRRGAAGLVVVLVLFAFCFLLFLTQMNHREASRRSACCSTLRQIGIALHNYHDRYGSFPPVYVADANGRPMHSWRVLILPFLDQQALYDQYRFDEPWNGSHNRALAEAIVREYVCPSRPGGDQLTTSYVAVTGSGTAWPGTRGMSVKGIRDGLSRTILVVEVADSGIHWMEPHDATIEEVLNAEGRSPAVPSSHHPFDGDYFVRPEMAVGHVLTADDGVHCLLGRPSREDLAALLSPGGGESVNINELVRFEPKTPLIKRLNWSHVVGLPLVVLSFLRLAFGPLWKRHVNAWAREMGPVENL